MRTYLTITLFSVLILTACKTTQTTQVVSTQLYSEDLSVHRPKFEEKIFEMDSNIAFEPSGHIRTEIDRVSKIIINRNRKPRSESGFTIQLYNGTNKVEASNILRKVRLKFPHLKSTLSYYQPDFRVKCGQFLDRIIAYETYQKVKKKFDEAILIPERIKFNHD